MGAFAATGSPFSVAAGRISYTFGYRGPAVSDSCLLFMVKILTAVSKMSAKYLGARGGLFRT